MIKKIIIIVCLVIPCNLALIYALSFVATPSDTVSISDSTSLPEKKLSDILTLSDQVGPDKSMLDSVSISELTAVPEKKLSDILTLTDQVGPDKSMLDSVSISELTAVPEKKLSDILTLTDQVGPDTNDALDIVAINEFPTVTFLSPTIGNGGGSGGGDKIAPFIKPGILSFNAGGISDITNNKTMSTQTLLHPNLIELETELIIQFNGSENQGVDNLAHATLYFGKDESKAILSESKTYVRYEKNKPLQVSDLDKIFSQANMRITKTDASNFELEYKIKFAKPMPKMSMLLRTWDLNQNAFESWYPDALIIEANPLQNNIINNTIPQTNLFNKTESVEDGQTIPSWIKNSAGLWATGQAKDSEFITGIQYLLERKIILQPVQEGLEKRIPLWFKNNALWWAEEKISDSDLVLGIQYLLEHNIMQI